MKSGRWCDTFQVVPEVISSFLELEQLMLREIIRGKCDN